MTTFDRNFARLLLEICRYTYASSYDDDSNKTDAEDALNWINSNNFGTYTITKLSNGDTSVACVFVYPDKNIVSYMGTKTEFGDIEDIEDSIKDWAKNAELVPVDFIMSERQLGLGNNDNPVNLGGHVHEGFLKELRAIQEAVISTLIANGGKEKPLYITGHSQGGAEAALATRAFSAGGFNVQATYTFAAPRPCNKEVADSIPKNIPVYRIEFGHDIVPHVPTTHAAHQILNGLSSALSTVRLSGKFIKEIDDNYNFVGIGRLCYGDEYPKEFRINMSPIAEKNIFYLRLRHLLSNPQDWAKHHHLVGTKDDVANNRKGNYTALVSDYKIING